VLLYFNFINLTYFTVYSRIGHCSKVYKRTTEKNTYTFIFLSLSVTQIFPNFAGFINQSVGNFIPLTLGTVLCAFTIAIGIKKLDKRVTLLVLTYFFVSSAYIVASIILSPYQTGISDFSDIVRTLSVAVFFIAGVHASRFSAKWPLNIYYILLIGCVLSFALWLSSLFGLSDTFISLFISRNIGGLNLGRLRFAGLWNYPYDSSFLYILTILLGLSLRQKRIIGRLQIVLVVTTCLTFIAFGQSRSSAISVFAAVSVIVILLVARLIFRPNVYALKWLLGISLYAVVLIALVYQFELYRYVSRIYAELQALNFSSSTRLEQINKYLGSISENPIRLLFGYGPSRQSELRLESMLEVLYRYGALGSMWIFFLFPLYAFFFLFRNVCMSVAKTDTVYLVFVTTLVMLITHGLSSPIITHYRLIPLLSLFSGCVYSSARRTIRVPLRAYV